MPSSFRDPKNLSEWIQLDYFQKPGRVWRIRNALTWSILIACLALVGLSWWPRARFVYESRPVSSAHAMFNDQCTVCHVETFQPLTRLLRADSSVRSVADETCRTCHDGPSHHGRDPHCATCHQEHRGRAVLARVADSQCTVCHADLNTVGGSPSGFAAKINGFTMDHPPWRRTDPGTIRFNHKVHLSLSPASVRGLNHPLIATKDQQQRCSYCHSLDHKPDAAGRYPKPVDYDQHCRQCHALSVAITGTWDAEKLRVATERFARAPAPHKDPLTVRAVLRERYTRFVTENPTVLGSQESAEPPRWVPGRPHVQSVTDKESLWVSQQLGVAERMLFDGANGCAFCHKAEAARRPGELPGYLLSGIPQVWLSHSLFSHERHRMLRCSECHDKATSSSDTKDVLLPNIDTCRQCHNSPVGARSDCAECHRYHDRAREVLRGQRTIADSLQKR
jgi:hypothetical protein